MELCISSRCVFAPWLHQGSFISPRMVSRQTSYSAFVRTLPSCHFVGSKEKVAVKATPLPSLQPHRSILKWGQMTHEPRVHLSLPCAGFLTLLFGSPFTLFEHSHGCGMLWREKTSVWLWSSKRFTLWCTKGRDTLLSACKKCHVWTACVGDNQMFLAAFLTCTSQTQENVSNGSVFNVSVCHP